jgi:hypothetical protein
MYALMILSPLGFLCAELLRVVSEAASTSLSYGHELAWRVVARGKSGIIAFETAGSQRVMKGVHFIGAKANSWEL